jgi:hypothetical protein
LTLREARCAFTRKLAELLVWAFGQGYEIAIDETRIAFRRKIRDEGKVKYAFDAQHMEGSLHYEGLAADLNLYIDGKWIHDGGHPAWALVGEKWEGLGRDAGLPLAWGGRFKDANHVSFAWQGRK